MSSVQSLRPFIIDCDTGRDDALAIWVALALELPVAGIVASYGNVALANVIDNTARVLALAGREDIPLLAGATHPMRKHRGFEEIVLPRQSVSGNGLCNLDFPPSGNPLPNPMAPEALAKRIADLAGKSGPLDYIILGPATNFSNICNVFGDDVRQYISTVTMMGGKLDSMWDGSPMADFNLICDPYAVRAVLEKGIPVRFVPLNATWPVSLPLDSVETLQGGGHIAVPARDLMIAHCRHFAPEPVFRFHDPTVIAAIMRPEQFRPASLDIVCDEKSGDFARLVQGDFPAELFQEEPSGGPVLLDLILKALGLSLQPLAADA